MNPANLLAITFPLPLRGAATTVADIASYKRQSLMLPDNAPEAIRLIAETRMAEYRARGTGNRARRRIQAIIARIEADIQHRQARLVDDLAHDTATEAFSRRPFRTNIHD